MRGGRLLSEALAAALALSSALVAAPLHADPLLDAAGGAAELNPALAPFGPPCGDVQAAQERESKPTFNSSTAADFCNRPYDTICGALNASQSAARYSRIAPIKEKIRKKAMRETALSLGRDPATFTEADLWTLVPGTFTFVSSIYYEKLAKVQREETGSLELKAVDDAGKTAKESLKKAIDARIKNSMGAFGPVFAKALKSKVDETRIITSLDANTLASLGESKIKDSLYEECGPDGMADNAFASHDSKGNPVVVLCPGLVIGGSSSGTNATDNLNNLLQTLGHELGHHIDGKKYAGIYKDYRSCLRSHHVAALNLPKNYIQNPFVDSRDVKLDNHIGEITADFWGAQTVAQYMKDANPKLGAAAKLKLVQETMAGYCGSMGSDAIHPSGRYRIEVLFRSDPQIAKQMGCTGPTTYVEPGKPAHFPKPGCTLNGETDDDMY